MKIQNILLTNIYLEHFAGTELNTLSIARELKRQGYEVEVATFEFEDPLATYFQQEHISVYNLLKEPVIAKHYDLILANHFPVLDFCLTTAQVNADKIVFINNSSIAAVEAPPEYINNLTYCLAVSNFLIPQLQGYNIPKEIIRLFPNFLTDDEFSLQGNPGIYLKKLAVISNHVPEVVYQAVEILRENNIDVDIYGRADIYKLLTARDLIPYDGILSIGKSVYWALGIGIPAFCFDRFSGPGWITDKNISTAFDYTFSGKGFDPVSPSPEELANQIISDYPLALASIDDCQKFIQSRCRLSTNLKNLLADIETQPVIEDPFSGTSKEVVQRRNEALVAYFRNFSMVKTQRKRLNKKVDELTQSNKQHVAEITKLEESNTEQTRIIEEMSSTIGWKLIVFGRKLLGGPYRFIKRLIIK